MENDKKKLSCSYSLLVIVLFATVCFLTCYIVIDRKMNKDNNTVQDNNNIVNNNSSSDCVNSNDNINSDNEIDNNSVVSKNFYKNLSDSIANTYVDGYLNKAQYAFYNNMSYVVSIDSSKVLSLRYSDDYENKYTIASNVVSFFNIYVGNGGLRVLYFIYDDGTVGKANIENGKFENHEFTVTEKVDGLKDIVYIYQGSWVDPVIGGGATNPFYVDINGNILGR